MGRGPGFPARATLTLSLVRLFAWNMPYHAEHHTYPAVPFHVTASVKVARHLFGAR